MFTKPPKKTESAPAIHTILGQDLLIKGELHTGTSSLRVEGRVEGTVHSEGVIQVAPTGVMHGTIHAKHLVVTGRVQGAIVVEQCLEIHGTGFVEGEIEVGSLVVDEGGTLQGTCVRRGLPSLGMEAAEPAREIPLDATEASESPVEAEVVVTPVKRVSRRPRKA